jgi:hypothetical protein
MPGLIAISIEKYATRPEVGKVSYENGLDDVGCMTFLVSVTLQNPQNDYLAIGIPPGNPES